MLLPISWMPQAIPQHMCFFVVVVVLFVCLFVVFNYFVCLLCFVLNLVKNKE